MEEQKKFGEVEIIVLLMLAIANDVLSIVVDLVFLVPLIGQAIGIGMEGFNLLIWAIILLTFIMKAGFKGGSGMLQIAGGVAQFFGIPARTIVVALGMYFVNHPKVAAVAGAALGKTEAFKQGSAKIGRLNEAAVQRMPESMRGRVQEAKEADRLAEGEAAKKAQEIEASRLGGAYEYRAQPGLGETLAVGSEQQPKGEEVGGQAGKEGVGEKEKEAEIEAERMGGAYAQTGEAQEEERKKELGLSEELGATKKKTDTVNVDDKTGKVDLSSPNDNIIDGRSRFGRKPPENEGLKKAA